LIWLPKVGELTSLVGSIFYLKDPRIFYKKLI
jgi:hypothetical protein